MSEASPLLVASHVTCSLHGASTLKLKLIIHSPSCNMRGYVRTQVDTDEHMAAMGGGDLRSGPDVSMGFTVMS